MLHLVEANPSSGTSAGNLNSIEIGGIKYDIPSGGGGGTTVIANPTGTPTDELNTIQIGNDIYSLPEGESEHLLNDILTGPDATKATASSTSQDGAIWKAFDGVKTGTEQSCWIPEYGSTNCWICYHFAAPKYITKCHVYFYENMNGTYTGAVKIQGSNDGETWTDISESQALSMTRGVHNYEIRSIDTSNGYSYVRMFSETALVVYGSASACTLELEIYGRDNASGTTVIPNPEGEATDTLTKIQIGNDIYSLPQGGSGGGGSIPAYSTNETSYCAWIDGTTVYQKTFTVDGDGTTREFTVQTGITNGKRLVNAHVSGLRWDSASRWWAPCYINIDNFSWSTHFSLNSDFSEFVVKAAQFPLKNITVTLYYTKTDDIPYHGGGGYTEITGTLTAGQTEIVLVDSSIRQNSTIEPFTDKFGVNPTNIEIIAAEELLNDILTGEDNTKVTASSSDTENVVPWKAFDGIKGTSSGTYTSPYHAWIPSNGEAPCWLQYHFATAKYIDEVKAYVYCNNSTYTGAAKVQGSNDGTTWEDISDSVSLSVASGVEQEIDFTCNGNTYEYVRLYSETAFCVYYNASIFVGEMEIYGRNGANGIKLTFPAQSENLGVKVRVS